MADNHLNAQQIQQAQAMATKYIEQLQLRKWAVEQAFKVVGTADELTKLATAIYEFTVQPTKMDVQS